MSVSWGQEQLQLAATAGLPSPRESEEEEEGPAVGVERVVESVAREGAAVGLLPAAEGERASSDRPWECG